MSSRCVPVSSLVFRGGGLYNEVLRVPLAIRYVDDPDSRDYDLGVRLVRRCS